MPDKTPNSTQHQPSAPLLAAAALVWPNGMFNDTPAPAKKPNIPKSKPLSAFESMLAEEEVASHKFEQNMRNGSHNNVVYTTGSKNNFGGLGAALNAALKATNTSPSDFKKYTPPTPTPAPKIEKTATVASSTTAATAAATATATATATTTTTTNAATTNTVKTNTAAAPFTPTVAANTTDSATATTTATTQPQPQPQLQVEETNLEANAEVEIEAAIENMAEVAIAAERATASPATIDAFTAAPAPATELESESESESELELKPEIELEPEFDPESSEPDAEIEADTETDTKTETDSVYAAIDIADDKDVTKDYVVDEEEDNTSSAFTATYTEEQPNAGYSNDSYEDQDESNFHASEVTAKSTSLSSGAQVLNTSDVRMATKLIAQELLDKYADSILDNDIMYLTTIARIGSDDLDEIRAIEAIIKRNAS